MKELMFYYFFTFSILCIFILKYTYFQKYKISEINIAVKDNQYNISYAVDNLKYINNDFFIFGMLLIEIR